MTKSSGIIVNINTIIKLSHTNPNNKLPVTCTNCHGQPSPQHREGVKDVMRFPTSRMAKLRAEQRLYVVCHRRNSQSVLAASMST